VEDLRAFQGSDIRDSKGHHPQGLTRRIHELDLETPIWIGLHSNPYVPDLQASLGEGPAQDHQVVFPDHLVLPSFGAG
jgi:hypothetical protein